MISIQSRENKVINYALECTLVSLYITWTYDIEVNLNIKIYKSGLNPIKLKIWDIINAHIPNF